MKLGRGSRRSIRYSIFIGVLAGSVFSGSGALANPLTQATFYSTISNNLDGNHVLGENIEISIADDGNAPSGLTVFGTFTGTLDGANYTIFGLTTPLFDSIGAAVDINDEDGIPIDTIEVKNLNLGDVGNPVSVSGRGALSNNLANGGTVDNVDVTGDVNADDYVGGLIGSSNGSINNSSVTGDVNGGDYVGGLVGEFSGSITNSSVTGDVNGGDYVGGLVGESNGSISASSATGVVTGDYSVGGLVGQSDGTISNNSYATGDVWGTNVVGGLVGYATGDITDSWAEGNVNSLSIAEFNGPIDYYPEVGFGGSLGGLVGWTTGNITNSRAIGNVNSTTAVTIENASNLIYISVAGGNSLGGLAGYAEGLISNSYAEGVVSSTATLNILSAAEGPVDGEIYLSASSNLGGLVGYSTGRITDSYAIGAVNSVATLTINNSLTSRIVAVREISTGGNLGGLVGYLIDDLFIQGDHDNLEALRIARPEPADGDIYRVADYLYAWDAATEDWVRIFHISNSFAEGNVTGGDNIGGLAGYSDGRISSSYASGDVTGSGEYIGGFIGDVAGGKIEDSFATGDVTGIGESNDEHGIGGFAGYLYGYLDNTYATGNVYGFYQVGGLVGSTGTATSIVNSYAIGDVTGRDEIGGLVGRLDDYHVILNSYAKGDVTGDDDIGGLVGNLQYGARITNSFAVGDVTATGTGSNGDAGGLVGDAEGLIVSSHATGDVSGDFDIGGLVGDLQNAGSITNSYATGNVRATGTDGDWSNGWGGLVGESSGLISNSYATGNVVADYNFGSLVGYLMLRENLDLQILNSFATGSTSRANNDVALQDDELLMGLGGFIGCTVEDGSEGYSCLDLYKSLPETTPSILSVVNSVAIGFEEEDPPFEVVACKNNGLPLLSILIDSYANTCTSNPPTASVSAVLASVVQLNPKFNLLESTTLRLFLYLAGDDTIRITVEDFVVLGVTGVNKANLPILLKLLKDVDLLTLDLKTINKNVKIADELLKKKKKK